MARQTPTVYRPSKTGTVVAMTAPVLVDGDAIPPDASLLVTNAGGSPITITVDTPGDAGDGLAIANYTLTVVNGTTELIGPFTDAVYRQSAGTTKGMVHVDYSAITSVTRAALGGL